MRALSALVAALLLLALAAAAPADGKQRRLKPVHGKVQAKIGIADQKPDVFDDPRFHALGLRLARRAVAWDALRHDWQVAELDQWLAAARRNRVRPVITFARSRIDARRHKPATVAQMRRAFKAFRARYPWVKDFVASNESNHGGEPTGRRPKLAARYYRAMRAACRSCKIAAATLLDQPNLVRWTRAFVRAAKEQPRYWALHNYVSANRFDPSRTKAFLRTVRGQVWITEVGGLVERRTKNNIRLPEGVVHQTKVTRYVLNRLARVSPRITRLYLYHWNSGGPESTWDSGLINRHDAPRPAFRALQRFLRRR